MNQQPCGLQPILLAAGIALCLSTARAADVTFFSYSDVHYGADNGGKAPPKAKDPMVEVINALPGTAYPASIGGTVDKPRAVVMQGDLVDNGAVNDKYPAQWTNYVADFGVHGEGRCKFPVFESVGNHDLNDNMFVFDQVKARNVVRKDLHLVDTVSSNGYHYAWDWDGVHFVDLNLFCGNVWNGEADAYGSAHNPLFSRDFLAEELRRSVGDSGRPVVVIQHFRPVDENWWTFSAADRFQRVLQDYNVITILVGHQGGGVNNVWRGINWVSSNGELDVLHVTPDNQLVAVGRSPTAWGTPLQKKIFLSYAASGLPAAVNNGDWASKLSPTGATLSGKLLYAAAAPTHVTAYWGESDGGTNAGAWPHALDLGAHAPGAAFTAEIAGLQPWTNYFYRCCATNAKGVAWAAASIPFSTPGELPAGWTAKFVGYEQRPWGGASGKDGVFTVRGSGRDIGERGERIDNFEFAYRTLEGDGEIVARVATMESHSREPKVGVMLRETLEENSRHAAVLLGAPGGVRLFARKAAGGATSTSKSDATKAPCWLKLVRRANVFTGFMSGDGKTWTPVGPETTLELPARIYAGLAVTAGNRDGSKNHTSEFDHVTVTGKP